MLSRDEKMFFRELDDGHSILAWEYDEMLDFFYAGARAVSATAKASWTTEPGPSTASILGVVKKGSGVVVGTADGRIYERSALRGQWEARFATKLPVLVELTAGPPPISSKRSLQSTRELHPTAEIAVPDQGRAIAQAVLGESAP